MPRASRPLEMPVDLGDGVVHRMYSLAHWGADDGVPGKRRRWRSWCRVTLVNGLPPGTARDLRAKISCVTCLTAQVPDVLRGWIPPFESEA